MRFMTRLALSLIALTGVLQAQQTRPADNNPGMTPQEVAAATAAAEQGGSGSYKAEMVMDINLPTHTIYRPRDMQPFAGNKLPVLVWANGACANVGNRFRYFLTEIASHGYLVVAIGPIGPQYLEGASSQLPPGYPPQTGGGPDPVRPAATQYTQLLDAIDWAGRINVAQSSAYNNKLDLSKVAVAGQSCGGVQAISASQDARVKTTMIWNSGTFPTGSAPLAGASATKETLPKLHAPIAYVSGDERDVAFVNSNADFDAINHIPVFRAYKKGVGHSDGHRHVNGGEFGQIAVKWLDWQLKGDAAARAWFVGADCTLCRTEGWVVRAKKL